jgi:bifunctional non-homologous end joining protein LigD
MLVIDDLPGLLELVQASVLEIHPWGAMAERPERPDRVTIDLDPGDNVPWQRVIDAAHDVRRRLAAVGPQSFVKTTGGKGLHVVFPLTPGADWDTVKAFAQSIASAMAADRPDLYTDNMAKSGRRGRIYVDYLRNGLGATAIGAYSTRARDGAPVSVPLGWDELGENIRSNHFTLLNLPNRLSFLEHDPWEGIGALKQTLPGASITAPSKAELTAHWKKVAKKALAYLARRPLVLDRKLTTGDLPKAVHADKDGRVWIDSVEGLLALAERGVVELLAVNATIDDPERPDQLVFALPAKDFKKAVDTAQRLRTLLKTEGLDSWPLLTGGLTGGPELHVMVPIEPDLDWREAERYSEQLARRLGNTAIDCRYNKRGAAAIAAYSPRALPGLPIAAPVEWAQLAKLAR